MKNLSTLACGVTLLFFFVISFYSSAQDVNVKSSINTAPGKPDFNGALLIQSKGKVLYKSIFDLSNSAFEIPNDKNGKHKIAYVSRLFTAVLIYQLYEKGTLDLNEPVRPRLPEYKGESIAKVSIHHPLTAISGIADLELKVDKITTITAFTRNHATQCRTP